MDETPKKKGIPGWGYLMVLVFIIALGLIMYSMATANPGPPKPAVYNDPYDASVKQVKAWFAANLKDPKSLEVIEWGKVVKYEIKYGLDKSIEDGSFKVRVKYRAKNSFGGFGVEEKVFSIDRGGGSITSVVDY
jgi:hypothetical protein